MIPGAAPLGGYPEASAPPNSGVPGAPSHQIARLGDPISHGGVITSASPNWRWNSIQVARVTDTVACAVHGTQTIVEGSPNYKVNGLAMARVGSRCSCGAIISAGSPNYSVS